MTGLVSPAAGFLTGAAEVGKNPLVTRHQHDMSTLRSHPSTGCGAGPPAGVEAWRRCRLREAGFSAELADEVASDPRFDLHALLQLVDSGCPPELAVRILAPLTAESAS